MKKIMASVLSIMMIVSLALPVSAEGGEATANGVEYATLEEALVVGGKITLLKDVALDSVTEVTNPTVLNLGDYTISTELANDRPIYVNTSSFVINANNGGMTVAEGNTGSYGFIKILSATEFSINGGIYTGNTDNGAFFRFEGSTTGTHLTFNNLEVSTNNDVVYFANTYNDLIMEANGGNYKVTTRAFLVDVIDCENSPVSFNNVTIVADRGPCIEMSGANTTLENCNFTVTGNYTGGNTWSRSAIGVGYEGNMTIKGGTYTGASDHMGTNEGYGVYVYSSGGHVTIEDGIFSGSTAAIRADIDSGTYETATANITVNGGETIGGWITSGEKASLTANGGSHTADIQQYLSSDIPYAKVSDGTTTNYVVGDTINEKGKGLDENGTIEVLSGNVDLTGVGLGVDVTNSGDGSVSINGVDVPKDKTVVSKPNENYTIMDGANQTWIGSGDLIIKGSGEDTDFDRVEVNGTVISDDKYTVTKGSTEVTFKESYLSSLNNGTYNVAMYWTDGGFATTTFTINKKSSGGGNSGGTVRPPRPTETEDDKDLPKTTAECQKEFSKDYIYSKDLKACVIKYMIADTSTK